MKGVGTIAALFLVLGNEGPTHYGSIVLAQSDSVRAHVCVCVPGVIGAACYHPWHLIKHSVVFN